MLHHSSTRSAFFVIFLSVALLLSGNSPKDRPPNALGVQLNCELAGALRLLKYYHPLFLLNMTPPPPPPKKTKKNNR